MHLPSCRNSTGLYLGLKNSIFPPPMMTLKKDLAVYRLSKGGNEGQFGLTNR